MKKLLVLASVVILTSTVIGLLMAASGPEKDAPFPEVPRMTAKQTEILLGTPDVVIIDARPVEQWKYSDQMIPHAVHEDPLNVESWAHKYRKDQTLIIY
ncbi:MAG: rhodanese-like domain-containing protein [Deltaproteobacteria bacterium]|nr:rhodanese-like domain-containing protein [Deltaproteobacteria bacterium]